MIQAALDEIARLRDVIAAKERAGVEREKKLVDGVQKVLEQRLGEHENQMRRFVQQVENNSSNKFIEQFVEQFIEQSPSKSSSNSTGRFLLPAVGAVVGGLSSSRW